MGVGGIAAHKLPIGTPLWCICFDLPLPLYITPTPNAHWLTKLDLAGPLSWSVGVLPTWSDARKCYMADAHRDGRNVWPLLPPSTRLQPRLDPETQQHLRDLSHCPLDSASVFATFFLRWLTLGHSKLLPVARGLWPPTSCRGWCV